VRIAFVTPGYPPDLGGVETVVGELARRMANAGEEVEVFGHAARDGGATSAWEDGVLVRRFRVPLPSREFAVSPGMLAELVRRRHDFDVIHAHNFHSLPAMGAALAGMRPLVFSPYFHGGGHSQAARLAHVAYRPLTRILFAACAHIVSASKAEAAALARSMPYIRSPVTVVPIGVVGDLDEARPFVETSPVVLAAGRMEHYKQFDRVVLAASWLPAESEIVLIGNGSARRDIERLVAARGLAGRVRIVGRVSDEDRRRWFRTAKVLVSMSTRESFGLTLVEALAAGIPVVASDIPAHREIAEQQPRGAVRLVAVDSAPEEIAKAIDAAVVSGLPSGVLIASWEEITKQLLGIYASVCGPSDPPARSASTSM
jgi:glycosyltransferase involved in cell wall biosynthesis